MQKPEVSTVNYVLIDRENFQEVQKTLFKLDFRWEDSNVKTFKDYEPGKFIIFDKVYKMMKYTGILPLDNKKAVSLEYLKTKLPQENEAWYNPKPSKKNTQPIPKNSFFVATGYPIPLHTSIDNPEDYADPHPIHMLKSGQNLKIGDIICRNDVYSVIKSKEDKQKPYDSIWRITDENNKQIKTFNIEKHSCGTLFDIDSKQILTEIPKGVQIEYIKEIPLSFEQHEIVKEFNISVEELQAQDELMHKQLSVILDHPLNIARKEWAYIWGPSGSGKSTLAIDYAKTSNKPYILQQGTAQLTVDDLLGYKSITTGEYFSSLLRDAVENGKVFILDEADACNSNTLLCLNALKNNTFQFPDKKVTIHKDFRLIMTANTFNDYSEEYSSRNPLDKATLDRCSILHYNMRDYHLALRYGLRYIKKIKLADKSPREIERKVINLQIQEEQQKTSKKI